MKLNKKIIFLICIALVTCLTSKAQALKQLERPTFSSGSKDDNRLTCTVGEALVGFRKGTGGSLSMGAQPGSAIRVGTNEIKPFEGLTLFPNPVSDFLTIDLKNTSILEGIFTIYDIEGRKTITGKVIFGSNIIDLSKLIKGSYICSISDVINTRISSFNIIKN